MTKPLILPSEMERKENMQVSVPDCRILPGVALPAKKTALLLSDMLVDFVSPKGKLFVPDTRKTIAPIRSLLEKARKSGAMIVYIQDWHRPDDPEFSIWGPHAIQETKGIRIIPELAPAPKDFMVRKRTYDPFFSTDLDLLLRQKGVQNLLITGTVANICVLHAAGSAALRGYQVVVPVDTISALNPFDFQAALRQISFVYRGKLTKSGGITFPEK
jgi:nicotinamidase-related amidase